MQPRRREVPRRGATRAAETCMMSPSLAAVQQPPRQHTLHSMYAGASNIRIHVRKENRPCCLFVPLFPASTPPGLASHADPGETLMLHVLPHSTMDQAAWCLPAGLPAVVCTYIHVCIVRRSGDPKRQQYHQSHINTTHASRPASCEAVAPPLARCLGIMADILPSSGG